MVRKRSLIFIFSILLTLYPLVLPASPVPRIQDLSIQPEKLADIMGDRQLMILHRERPLKVNNKTEKVRFVTSMAVMDTNISQVRETVLDVDSYDQFVPQTEMTKTVSQKGEIFKTKFHLLLEMPIKNTHLYYTNQYTQKPSGDVTFKLVSGDLSAAYGRYEFIKLNDQQTLVIYTLWTDLVSGFGYLSPANAMYSAQPDLKIAVPVSQNAVFMRAIRNRIENSNANKKSIEDTPPSTPEIPTFTDKSLPKSSLQSLYNQGTLLFVHRPRLIQNNEDGLDIQFVSAMGIANAPLERSRQLLTRFENFPRFVEQVSSVESRQTEYGYNADWHLSIGLGFLAAGIDYQLDYRWQNQKKKRALKYKIQPGGDLDHVYGALEWAPVNSSKTIYFYTVSSQIGKNASYLVKLGNLIPNRQLVIGVSSGALAVEKQMEWINNEMVGEIKANTKTE